MIGRLIGAVLCLLLGSFLIWMGNEVLEHPETVDDPEEQGFGQFALACGKVLTVLAAGLAVSVYIPMTQL